MLLPFGWPNVRVAGTVSEKVSNIAQARSVNKKESIPVVSEAAEKLSVPVQADSVAPSQADVAEIAATEAQIAELEAETAVLKTKLAEEKA